MGKSTKSVEVNDAERRPIKAVERLTELDALRGFALLGILFVNITWFTGFAVLSGEEREAFRSADLDSTVYWLVHVLVDSKFWSIFALLFGVGLAMKIQRLKADDAGPSLLLRRLLILTVIGLMHGIFIWFGDIIALYAVAGFVLVFCWRLPKLWIILLAIYFLLLPIAHTAIWNWVFGMMNQDGSMKLDLGLGPEGLLPHFASGNWPEWFEANWAYFKKRWFLAVYEGRFYKLIGLFLLGYYAVVAGWIEQLQQRRSGLFWVAIGGLIVGLPINLYLANGVSKDPFAEVVCQVIGVPALALCYASTFLLVYTLIPRSRIWNVFTWAGRMSLTNYITQSIVGVLLFYGIGMGLWGSFGITWAIVFVICLFLIQSFLSFVWLQKYRYGPLEWLTRCAIYKKKLPIRASTVNRH